MADDNLVPLDRLERRPTAEIIAEAVRQRIMDGTYPAGSQLGEAELARQLGVSRSPVREALQRLAVEGLVIAEAHRGVFVKSIDADDVVDVYRARLVVEREAARMLAEGENGPEVAELAAMVERMADAATQGRWAGISETDLAFHALLVRSAGSTRLTRMYETLLVETRLCLRDLRAVDPDPQAVVSEHRALVEAIADHDADAAVACVEDHLDRATRARATPA